MGRYRDRVVPRLVDVVCGIKRNDALRRRVCQDLTGRVLELGFGSGRNVPFYPAAVTEVYAVEPADLGWELAGQRVADSPVPVTRVGLDGASLPLPDGSCDAALSTWTLCTIPDVRAALREVRRVLRPGGTLHVAEHGLAPDRSVQRWQARLEPVQKVVAGGCHLTRPVVRLLEDTGFEVVAAEEYYEKGVPRSLAAMTVARAVSR